jgi:hypothetical protein
VVFLPPCPAGYCTSTNRWLARFEQARPDKTFLLEVVGDHRAPLLVGLLELKLRLNALEFTACFGAEGIIRGEHGGYLPEARRFCQPIEFRQSAGQLGGKLRFLADAQLLAGKK